MRTNINLKWTIEHFKIIFSFPEQVQHNLTRKVLKALRDCSNMQICKKE